ncbi:hypothetical protein M3Y99_01621700 [Aphelenchoides fujianensis]|nr:hypothetical protein M3Y99_01621700 [Aphelenchoides fujianensis]
MGLSELLTNAAELYDSLFYSMAFSVTLRPSGLWSSHVQMNLLKPSISSKQLSVFSIFRQKITSVCPVATKSTVVLEESPKRTIELDANEKNALVANPALNMTTATMEKNFIEFSLFTRESFFVRGKFISTIKSTANTPTRAVFVHLLPWQLHLWHSTVRFACNGRERKPHMRFSPKHGRNAPVLIEMMVDIPPQSQCEISYSFQKGFLRFDEYPPDSSSGIHVPGPILNILPGQWSQSAIQIHAESTIILLPIPDFSMPFNVICFVCTFVAFLFQLLLTFTTKYPSVVESPSKSLVAKVVEKVRKLGREVPQEAGVKAMVVVCD